MRRKPQQPPRYHSNCARPMAERPSQGPATPFARNAAQAGRPTRRSGEPLYPRTSGSGAIEPGSTCRRLAPPTGSLRGHVPVPLRHRFGDIIKSGEVFVNRGFSCSFQKWSVRGTNPEREFFSGTFPDARLKPPGRMCYNTRQTNVIVDFIPFSAPAGAAGKPGRRTELMQVATRRSHLCSIFFPPPWRRRRWPWTSG